ncbi:MAG: ankyrin repeat domain-containing protein [Vulcanimicrobiota bacterium]
MKNKLVLVLIIVVTMSSVYSQSLPELRAAIISGDISRVSRIITEKPSLINKADAQGLTPLHVASQKGKNSIIALLLENKANFKARDNAGALALHWACLYGHIEAVKILIGNTDTVNFKDNKGATPLHYGVRSGNIKTVQYLINRGADVNARTEDNLTPYMLANTTEMRELLRCNGAVK